MIEWIKQFFINWYRKRLFYRIRREFAGCGYPLDHLNDREIEKVVTGGKCRIENFSLSAKTIYFALRRLKNEKQ